MRTRPSDAEIERVQQLIFCASERVVRRVLTEVVDSIAYHWGDTDGQINSILQFLKDANMLPGDVGKENN